MTSRIHQKINVRMLQKTLYKIEVLDHLLLLPKLPYSVVWTQLKMKFIWTRRTTIVNLNCMDLFLKNHLTTEQTNFKMTKKTKVISLWFYEFFFNFHRNILISRVFFIRWWWRQKSSKNYWRYCCRPAVIFWRPHRE